MAIRQKLNNRAIRLWATLIILSASVAGAFGAQFKDSIAAFGEGRKGINKAIEAMAFFNKAFAKMQFESRADRFLTFVEESLNDFDFMQLYSSSYLKKDDDGYRSVTLQAMNKPESYFVSLTNVPYYSGDFSEFGNVKSTWGLRKNDKPVIGDRSFEGRVRVKAGIGDFNHRQFTDWLDRLMRVLDPENIKSLNSPNSRIFPNMQNESRKIIDEFVVSFPNLSKFLSRYTYLKQLLTIKYHEDQPYTEFKMRGALNMDAIYGDFEALGEWLDDVNELFKIRIYLNDASAHNLSTLYINPENYEITWSFYSHKGKVIPRHPVKGTPYFKKAYAITDVRDYEFYGIGDFRANIYGLKFKTGHITVYNKYKNHPEEASLLSKLVKFDKMTVSGAFYSVIPTWMIDMVIPSNIEQLINDFVTVMAKANGGKGTRGHLKVKPETEGNRLYFSGDSEFLDNRFVRIGLKIWSRKFRPSKDAEKDMRRFGAKTTGAWLKDLRRL